MYIILVEQYEKEKITEQFYSTNLWAILSCIQVLSHILAKETYIF